MSAPRRAFKRVGWYEPHPILRLLAKHRADADNIDAAPVLKPILGDRCILEVAGKDLATNVNHFTLAQSGPAHHLSKQQKNRGRPMALYRAMAAVIFGSLAIAVSSATRLYGCCAWAGLWDPAQKFAGSKGRPGVATPRRSKRSHPRCSQPRLPDLALQPRCQEGRSDISRVFGAMLSIPLLQANPLQRIRRGWG